MDIFEYAMQVEKDGEEFYRNLSRTTENHGLRTILTILADAEVSHFHHFQKMKNNQTTKVDDAMILTKTKTIFQALKDEGSSIDPDTDHIELYQQALELEKESEKFYLEKANEILDINQKAVLLTIAEEEKKHFVILEYIIDFITRPNSWLENAEWRNLDEF